MDEDGAECERPSAAGGVERIRGATGLGTAAGGTTRFGWKISMAGRAWPGRSGRQHDSVERIGREENIADGPSLDAS
jgi:hypothetical protein